MSRYREARERAGLTIPQAIVLLLDTDLPSVLHSIEGCARTPTPEQRARLAALYNVSECWLQHHEIAVDPEIAARLRASDLAPRDVESIECLIVSRAQCASCSNEPANVLVGMAARGSARSSAR